MSLWDTQIMLSQYTSHAPDSTICIIVSAYDIFFIIQQADVPIKLNAATIMREGKLFKEREQEVIKK